MADEYAVVTVWLGSFRSAERFDAYFAETYEDDDSPISEFGREQEEHFYDHDFVETSFREEPTNDVRALLRDHSFSSSFRDAVAERVDASFNAVVLVWNREVEHPRTVTGDDYRLELIGTFACDPNAPDE